MSDSVYKTWNLLMSSIGVTSRYVDDAAPNSSFLNMDNTEEQAETSLAPRLGTTIINRSGATPDTFSGGAVHSLAKLTGLNSTAFRYAGCGANLYRRNNLTPGPYTLISTTFNGQPWTGVLYRPDLTSIPYMFFADLSGMRKDSGTFSAPQQMGIFQPQYPVVAQAQAPICFPLDDYTGAASTYTYSGISGGTNTTYVSTVSNNAVTTGVQEMSVASPTQPALFQFLTIDTGGNEEQVLVIFVTATGFIANFTKAHASGVTVTMPSLEVVVPASTTATVSIAFGGGKPISSWPTTLQLEDYIALFIYTSDPSQIQSITLKVDVGDGSFNTDYFYKVIAQGPLQTLLNTTTDPETASTDALLSGALGLFGNTDSSLAPLNSGLAQWTPFLQQLSSFASAGRADFNDPVFNWQNANGYLIEIVTNPNNGATVQLSSLSIFGGAGPDSLGGVAYDYVFTFFNNVDGTESNPSMFMSNINPPQQTTWVVPRRQGVLLTLTYPRLDTQTTSLRIYRRGGTLGDNFRRVDEVLITGSPQQYLDISPDDEVEDGDIVSLTNDVPVTSTLPVPVQTTLATAITSAAAVVSVFPVSMANISINQQVIVGNETSLSLTNDVEIVVVIGVFSDHFTAYVQNTHAAGETISATAFYGQPVNIMALAFNQMFFAGDANNPHYLYYSAASNPQAVGSASFIEIGDPGDPITVIVNFGGNLYVSTKKFWYSIAPGSNENGNKPIPYPTKTKHGCVAPFGYIITEDGIWYQAVDGIRFFAGSASQYLTQEQEFIFQAAGASLIEKANPNTLNLTRAAYWNNMLFFSYVGNDGNRHRLIYHQIYKRFRNDDVDAASMLLEADAVPNVLVFGDSNGYTHIDRVGNTDDLVVTGAVVASPIDMTFQLPYKDQGMPAEQKQYNEFTIDCNTAGQTLNIVLSFNDGEFFESIGSVNTTERQRVNITLNDGDGFQAYKVSAQVQGLCSAAAMVYQMAIRALPLAKTRQSMDTFNRKFGTDESKLIKNYYIEYTATAELTGTITYDDPCWPPFTFTLPSNGGVRNPYRLRLPAVKLRFQRCVITSTADFQIWDDSAWDVKPVASGKGYNKFKMDNVEM